MIDLRERSSSTTEQFQSGAVADERPARRSLHGQIGRLERELAKLSAAAWPRQGIELRVGHPSGRPRLRDLGELERIRDALVARVADARAQLRERHAVESANRRLIDDMLRQPEEHRWVRVGNADIGEPGCHHWHVVPRWGLIGMFANWWRVKISSGCPLAT